MSPESSDAVPSPRAFASVFRVYEVRQNGDSVRYYGDPLTNQEALLRTVWPLFRERGYDVSFTRETGEYVLVAEPVDVSVDGVPWTNIVLLGLTVLSTLYAGSAWYYADLAADPWTLLRGLPFVAAVLGVLGTHELGHYVMSRYHRVDASLPYFIPVPSFIGTMGAVIRMKGHIPDRRALFDIGVAGPLAGLVATVVVTAVGLTLPPVHVPDWVFSATQTVELEFGYPPLIHIIAWVVGQPLVYDDPHLAVNPVVIGGWVGMFVTFLNLLPVGQLDGGHIVRAILGPRQETVAALVPGALFALAGYLYFFTEVSDAAGIWAFWGVLTTVVAYAGSARPISDERLDARRTLLGVLTLVLGVLCFTPVPIRFVG
ncbi:MAG: site-2 protease family protein [Halobacteriaceae archaeon]